MIKEILALERGRGNIREVFKSMSIYHWLLVLTVDSFFFLAILNNF